MMRFFSYLFYARGKCIGWAKPVAAEMHSKAIKSSKKNHNMKTGLGNIMSQYTEDQNI